VAEVRLKRKQIWWCLWGVGVVLWITVYIQLAYAKSKTVILTTNVDQKADTLAFQSRGPDSSETRKDVVRKSQISDEKEVQSDPVDTIHKGQKVESQQKCIPINKAGVDELVALPGIGPVLAERIVSFRHENGNFKEASDLIKVKGIGEGKLRKIKEHICF